MATTTTPNVETTPKLPVNLTPMAVSKVKEIMGQQNPVPAGLRIGVVGAAAPVSPTPCPLKTLRASWTRSIPLTT